MTEKKPVQGKTSCIKIVLGVALPCIFLAGFAALVLAPGVLTLPNRRETQEPALPAKVELTGGPMAEVDIQETWFPMGCAEGEPGCQPNDRPRRNVRLDAYAIDKTEVTVEQYALCVHTRECTPPSTGPGCNFGLGGRDTHPVNCVSESQARAYCEWVGKRLPTEAEWERAARGDRGFGFPWGGLPPTCQRVVMNEGGAGCGQGTTWPVCSRPASNSPEGLCDLAGNVWEYVNDTYRPDYHLQTGRDNPKIPVFREARGLRGGSYMDRDAVLFRGFNRQGPEDWISPASIGFRCARPLKGWTWSEK